MKIHKKDNSIIKMLKYYPTLYKLLKIILDWLTNLTSSFNKSKISKDEKQ